MSSIASVRLEPEVRATYQRLANLLGVPISVVLREALTDAAPTIAELVDSLEASRGSGPAGVMSALHAVMGDKVNEAYAQMAELRRDIASQKAGAAQEVARVR